MKVDSKTSIHDLMEEIPAGSIDTEVYGSYRVFRGGGWCDEERSVMATTRRRSHPSKFKIDDLGFRVARNKYK